MDYPVEKSTEVSTRPQSAQNLTAETTEPVQQAVEQALKQAPQRNEHGQWLPGVCGNLSGRRKKPISSILEALVHTKEGQRAVLKAARQQLRVSGYNPAMSTYLRETVEGKLVERVEVQGGLELSARIRRAKQRLAEAHNDAEDHTPSDE